MRLTQINAALAPANILANMDKRLEITMADGLTERHLLLFGSIIQWFARHELLMQEVMATVAGSDVGSVMLLTRGLDFGGKRQALLDLLRHRIVPLDQFDRVREYLLVPHSFTSLRNDIAHSAWTEGETQGWIQPDWVLRLPPGVKPLHDDPYAPGQGFIETDQDKTEYTLNDLSEAVEALAQNHDEFSAYLREVGLIRSDRSSESHSRK